MGGWEILAAAPATAALGAYLGLRLGVPAGAFTGAMVGVGVLLAVLGFPSVGTPPVLGQSLQVMVGVLVGFRISRGSLSSGARTLLPATALAGLFLFSAVLERFLGQYVSINSFSQLVVRALQKKNVVKRWPPRSGEQILL